MRPRERSEATTPFFEASETYEAVLARCKVQPGGKFKTRGMVLYNVSSEAWNGDFQKILRNTDPYKVILRWRDETAWEFEESENFVQGCFGIFLFREI